MTSMPASRSARAMTLAPRSWPSSPGFAMTTRIFRIRPESAIRNPQSAMSYDGHFHVLPPDVPERIAHLADRRVRADRVEDRRHHVVAAARGGAQPIQRANDGVRIAPLLEPFELHELLLRRRFVDVEDLDRRLVRLDE